MIGARAFLCMCVRDSAREGGRRACGLSTAASEPPPLMCETCGAGPFKKQHGLNLHKTRWCVKEKDADETRAREEAPPPPPVKRGRGRPKGSKNKNKFLGELD